MNRHLILIGGFCLAAAAATAEERGLKARALLGDDVQTPTYHALVIGVNDYRYWQNLRQARSDAQELAGLLRTRYGFENIRTLYDQEASLSAMIQVLRELTRELTSRDALLIYYAGHGYYDALLKKGYWVPSEGRERIGNEPAINDWLHNTTLKEFTDAMKARHVLIVSDSCFSGSLMRGGRVDLNDKAHTWYRRAIGQPTRWGMASGDLETVPDQSVFAAKFIQALRYPRQPVFAASDLAGWIRGEIAAHTGRHPVFGPLQSVSGGDIGEFIFLAHDDPVASPPEAVPSRGAIPAPVPQQVAYGTLVIESPVNATVEVDGGKAYPLAAGKALRWDKMPVGMRAVTVRSGNLHWEASVRVDEGQTRTVSAFPDETRRVEREARAREEAAALERARAATRAAAEAEAERRRLERETAELRRRLEAEREASEQTERKRYRPRAH